MDLNSKFYIHTSGGGHNKCIRINGYSVLPNCVGYAYGRFMEMSNKKSCKLPMCNAEDWWAKCKGVYERGQTPKVGAVICWRKGKVNNSKDGCGHVAIVEKVYSDGSILISQSGYGCSRKEWEQTLKKPYTLSGYVLQGFVYNPYVENVITEVKKKGYTGTFPTGTIKNGTKGTQAKRCQQFLNWYGNYGLVCDGIFGAKSVSALKKFQKAMGITTDGVWGSNTLKKAKAVKK